MADIQQLEESIVSLSLLEASALVKKLEERLGVSAAAAVAAAPAAGGGAAAAAPAEEKTEFTVILKDAGANKINTIKAVREVTALEGAKDSRRSSQALKENISKDDAAAIAKKSRREISSKPSLHPGRDDILYAKNSFASVFPWRAYFGKIWLYPVILSRGWGPAICA